MSAAIVGTGQRLFGLFELDPAGTILYSRAEEGGRSFAAGPEVSGRNYFEEVAPFANVEEFRRRVSQFALGQSPADSFHFDCLLDGRAEHVKVLLARVRERSDGARTKSILIHIRKG